MALAIFPHKFSLAYVAILAAVTSYLKRELIFAVAFGLVQAVSVAAGCLFELLLLTKKFWNVELSPGNIYANLSTFVTVLIPGVILCLAPMMVCFALGFSNILYALVV
ncbi:MAG: hypothetical protein QW493_04925, partial [Candidatus Bathyarchaeia archaeon]